MSNQPQEQSYVDVKLLDCSRRSSIEYTSGNEANNAIFTNKLNSGIQKKNCSLSAEQEFNNVIK